MAVVSLSVEATLSVLRLERRRAANKRHAERRAWLRKEQRASDARTTGERYRDTLYRNIANGTTELAGKRRLSPDRILKAEAFILHSRRTVVVSLACGPKPTWVKQGDKRLTEPLPMTVNGGWGECSRLAYAKSRELGYKLAYWEPDYVS